MDTSPPMAPPVLPVGAVGVGTEVIEPGSPGPSESETPTEAEGKRSIEVCGMTFVWVAKIVVD